MDELTNVDQKLKELEQELQVLRNSRAEIMTTIKERELQRRKEAFAAYRKPLAALMEQILSDDLLSFQCPDCHDRYPRAYEDLFEHECLRMCEYRPPCGHSICFGCAVRSLKYEVDFSTLIGVSQLCIKCPICPATYRMSITELEDAGDDAITLAIEDPLHITCPGTPHLDDSDMDEDDSTE